MNKKITFTLVFALTLSSIILPVYAKNPNQ